MHLTTLRKLVAGAAAVALAGLPIALCLAFRGMEAWKLWREMSQFTVLGVIVWLWATAFLAAALVTIFRLDTRPNLRRWELLIDAGNTATSALLALQCADRHVGPLPALPYAWRAALLFIICLVPQLTVTFAARRAREVVRRLQRLSRQTPRARAAATDLERPVRARVATVDI